MDLDINERYRYCFGITIPNGHQPEDVVLSFNRFQGEYIKSLPLLSSQQILIDDAIEIRVQLKPCITPDFLMELLSFGENLRVLQPQSLIEKLNSTAETIQRKYEEV